MFHYPCLLAGLKLFADDDAFLNVPTSPELGDIKLEIFEVKVQGKGKFNPLPIPASDDEKIHERSKKAVGHRVKSVFFALLLLLLNLTWKSDSVRKSVVERNSLSQSKSCDTL